MTSAMRRVAVLLVLTASAAFPAVPPPVLFMDFDGDGSLVLVGRDGVRRMAVDPRHRKPGLRGGGLFFEAESANALPPEIAKPGPGTLAAVAAENADIALAPGDAVLPPSSLRVAPRSAGAALRLPAVAIDRRPNSMERTRSYVFSFSMKARRSAGAAPSVGLLLAASFKAGTETKEARATAEFRLAPEWKRYALLLDLPANAAGERIAPSFSWPSAAAGDEFLLDCLQLEPAKNYPQYAEAPTSWMPGGTARENVFPSMPGADLPLPVRRGTVSLYLRRDPGFPGMSAGETTWLFIGRTWNPLLELSSSSVSLFGNRIPAAKIAPALSDGMFHHVALAWDETSAGLFIDGAEVGRTALPAPPALSADDRFSCRLIVGAHNPRRRTAGGTVDEIAFFGEPLDAAQLAEVSRLGPRVVEQRPVRFFPPARNSFTRDEESPAIEIDVILRDPAARATAAVADLPGAVCSVAPASGARRRVRVSFKPRLFPVGRRACTLSVGSGAESASIPLDIAVCPSRPRDSYPVAAWGVQRLQPAALAELAALGVGAIDSQADDPAYLDMLPRHRVDAILHLNAYQTEPHPWTAANRDRYRERAAAAAEAVAPFPWVSYCLLNSEISGRDDVAKSPEALALLKADLGLDRPPLPSGDGWEDLAVRPRADLSAFAATGVVPADHATSRYVRWLCTRGGGPTLVAGLVGGILRAGAPWIKLLSEPAGKMPYLAGRHAGSDLVGEWHYPREPERLVARWKWGLAEARMENLGFYPIIGYMYAPEVKGTVDGKEAAFSLSPDMAAAQIMLALAQPSRFLMIWYFDTRKQESRGIKDQPGLYERTRSVLTGPAAAIGPVLGGVPADRPPLAVLNSFTTAVGLGKERWWHWYPGLLHDFSSALVSLNVPFDVVYEDDIRAGALSGYRTLWLPAVKYLPADVHAAIGAWRRAGGTVVADTFANAGLDLGDAPRIPLFEEKPPYCTAERLAAWADSHLAAFPPPVRAVKGRLLLPVKQAGPVRYVFAVNNLWEKGWAAERGGAVADRGVRQEAAVEIAGAETAAVYDMTAGGPARTEGRTIRFSLEPGEGKVFAVFPRRLAAPSCALPEAVVRGETGEAAVAIADDAGRPAPGVQGIDVTIADPSGARYDGSGIYRMENGRTTIPLRPAADAPEGRWTFSARDIATGLRVERVFRVSAGR